MELVHFWGQLLFWLRAGSSPCRASQGCIVCANKLKRTATWSTQVNKEHKCVSSSYPAFALLSASRGQKTQQTREGNPHPSHAASAAVLHGFTETTVPHFHTTRRQDFMCLQHQMYFAGSVRWVLQGRDQRHETHDWDGVEVFEPSIGRGVEMVDRLNSGVGFEHSSQRSSVS